MNTIGLIWHEWFNEDVKCRASEELGPMVGFYRRNNILKITALKWIREKIYDTNGGDIDEQELENIRDIWIKKQGCVHENWKEDKRIVEVMSNSYLDYNELEKYFRREAAANAWAKTKWEKITPQLYLSKKENYDIVNVEIITSSKEEKNMMKEVYYCIKDENITFGDILKKKNKALRGTVKPIDIKISEMNNEMKYYAGRANIGKVYGPLLVDNKLIIFRVLKKIQGKLNDEIKQSLIDECMKKFLELGSSNLCEYLCDKAE